MVGNIYSLIHHELQYYLYRCDPVVVENNARLSFEIPRKLKVRLVIFDINGNEVKEIINRELGSGFFEENVDCKELPTGKYIYKLTAGGFTDENAFFVIR